MEKQNKNEELSDVNKAPVEDKKPKKKSNASKMIVFLGGIVVVIMVFLIATGAWNPFKSQEIAKDAKEIVENSEEYYMDLAMSTGRDKEFVDSSPVIGPNGQYPYGGITTDYGENGNAFGVIKKFETVSTMYDSKYGGCFIQYVMKNEEYAKEKYNGMVSGEDSKTFTVEEEKNLGNVDIYTYYNGNDTNFFIRQGSVVYDFWGLAKDGQGMDQIPLTQSFFDYLKIDYKVPQAV